MRRANIQQKLVRSVTIAKPSSVKTTAVVLRHQHYVHFCHNKFCCAVLLQVQKLTSLQVFDDLIPAFDGRVAFFMICLRTHSHEKKHLHFKCVKFLTKKINFLFDSRPLIVRLGLQTLHRHFKKSLNDRANTIFEGLINDGKY